MFSIKINTTYFKWSISIFQWENVSRSNFKKKENIQSEVSQRDILISPPPPSSSVVLLYIHSALYFTNPLSYFSFQPVLHDWCNKGRGMCYPVCGMVHIKEPLLLKEKSSPCGSSRFPISLSVWYFTIP